MNNKNNERKKRKKEAKQRRVKQKRVKNPTITNLRGYESTTHDTHRHTSADKLSEYIHSNYEHCAFVQVHSIAE